MSGSALRIGLLGLGTVGCGVVSILARNGDIISRRLERRFEVTKALVRDTGKPRPPECGSVALTRDAWEIVRDPAVDVVVEVMGGIEPARTYVVESLKAGKDVVTANKDLIALHGRELLDVASEAGRDLLFEASVAGGIPIIAALKQALAGNRISRITGIINGTTNYILTAMAESERTYEEALRDAQDLGYAEADPSSDVEGRDAAYKLAILASIAFGTPVAVSDIHVEGISRIERADLAYAALLGSTIKLLGLAREDDGRIEARVSPTILPNSHPLASIRGVFNAVHVEGDAVGEAMFYGRGAGSLPTGSAVVADLIQVARNRRAAGNGRLNCTCYRRLAVKSPDEFRSAFYVRLHVRDEIRVLASIAGLFAEAGVSFASIIQKPRPDSEAEIVMVTHPCLEGQVRRAVASLGDYSKVLTVRNVIRVERTDP